MESDSLQEDVHVWVELCMSALPDEETKQQIHDSVRRIFGTHHVESFQEALQKKEVLGWFSKDIMHASADVIVVGSVESIQHSMGGSKIHITCYTLPAEYLSTSFDQIASSDGVDRDVPTYRLTALPSSQLLNLWNRLHFRPAFHVQMLRALDRLLFEKGTANEKILPYAWHGTILLHGPPGTGKSTLARALAQKLSINLQGVFSSAMLMEVNATALFSKYFGESAKLVDELFEKAGKLLQAHSGMLLFIVIDEVESLAGSRAAESSSSDPKDSLRAVNALLTCLDRASLLHNLVMIFTSNLEKVLDGAFIDRLDYVKHVPLPNARSRYEFLRMQYLDLVHRGIFDQRTEEQASRRSENHELNRNEIETYATMLLQLEEKPNSASSLLHRVAGISDGLSPRKLERLPMLAVAERYGRDQQCLLTDAILALERTVMEMKHMALEA